MRFQIAVSAFAALLLSGCMSYSGTYQHDMAYADDGYYDASDASPQDDGYYDSGYSSDDDYGSGYYDSGFYGGGFYGNSYGFDDPFLYGGNYRYCSLGYAFCPRDPLAVFLFPIGGGRYWLLFDGYDERSYYGGGYGYGWPYWGWPRDDYDHDGDHHRHHHHRDNPPDPVVVTPPGNPGPPGGRLFLTPHPRKGVFRPNAMPEPQPTIDVGDNGRPPRVRVNDGSENENDPSLRWRNRPTTMPEPRPMIDVGDNGRPPQARLNDGSENDPSLRWRNRPATTPAPVDQGPPGGWRSNSSENRQTFVSSNQPGRRMPEPTLRSRPVDSTPVTGPTRSSDSTPNPSPARDNDGNRPSRNHPRDEDAGGGR